MKALSLWPPYGSLIVAGVKKIETRSWPTAYRGRIAIHHTKKWMPETDSLLIKDHIFRQAVGALGGIEVGCIVGTANLIACEKMTPGLIEMIPELEMALGHYELGRWMWMLQDVVKFDKPIPCKGKQGLWEWSGA